MKVTNKTNGAHNRQLRYIVPELMEELKTDDPERISRHIEEEGIMSEDSSDHGEKLQRDVRQIIDKINKGEITIGDHKGNGPDPGENWREYVVTSEPPEEPALIEKDGVTLATAGNHSLIMGKKKSRKSLLVVYLLSLYKGNLSKDALLCDTEQGKRHVWKQMDRIKRMTGQEVTTLFLRGKSPAERIAIIEAAIREKKPKIVVIDGVRDLLSDINDPGQSTNLIVWLERITLEFNVHIINILHQNKTDGNARGHIGSELLNKAEITINLELDEKAECTIVRCDNARDIPFEAFAFAHDENGLPEIVDVPIKGVTISDSDRKKRLKHIFSDGALKYAEVIGAIQENFDVGEKKARVLLASFIRESEVVKIGDVRSKNVIYKLPVKPSIFDDSKTASDMPHMKKGVKNGVRKRG